MTAEAIDFRYKVPFGTVRGDKVYMSLEFFQSLHDLRDRATGGAAPSQLPTRTFYQTTAPDTTVAREGDLWFDTDDTQGASYRLTSGTWVQSGIKTAQLGANGSVLREDGVTKATDAAVVTALGTAAAITGQGSWATALGLNVNGGVSGAFSAQPISSTTSTSIVMAAVTWSNPFTTVSLPSATISGLSPSTRYYVFRDVTGAAYIATSAFATATTYYNDNTGRYLSCGSVATPASGSGGGGGGGGGLGGGGGGVLP